MRGVVGLRSDITAQIAAPLQYSLGVMQALALPCFECTRLIGGADCLRESRGIIGRFGNAQADMRARGAGGVAD